MCFDGILPNRGNILNFLGEFDWRLVGDLVMGTDGDEGYEENVRFEIGKRNEEEVIFIYFTNELDTIWKLTNLIIL